MRNWPKTTKNIGLHLRNFILKLTKEPFVFRFPTRNVHICEAKYTTDLTGNKSYSLKNNVILHAEHIGRNFEEHLVTFFLHTYSAIHNLLTNFNVNKLKV